MRMKYNIKLGGYSKSGKKREVYVITGPLHKTRKLSNKHLNTSPYRTRKSKMSIGGRKEYKLEQN